MVSTRKRKYTTRVPREGGDANSEPNLALNGKWTLATGKVLNSSKKNWKCRVVLDDVMSGKSKSKPKVICSGCLRYLNGIKGLNIHLSKSTCLQTVVEETHDVAKEESKKKRKATSNHSLCETCPILERKTKFRSTMTGREYSCVGVNSKNISCKIQNYIYLLTCTGCNMQYVGESIIPLHKRMNIHRKNKTGCEILIDHFSNVCPGQKFAVQVIQKLDGDGYKNGSRDKKMYQKRLQIEDEWIKCLRTTYPYGLNDKVKGKNKGEPVGISFSKLPRHGARNKMQTRNKTGGSPCLNIDSFFGDVFSHSIDERANFCRKRLEMLSMKNLRKLALEAESKLSVCNETTLIRWYEVVVDTFLSKKFKPIEKKKKNRVSKSYISINFHNKGLDFIKLQSILRNREVSDAFQLGRGEVETPTVVYKLNASIRSKLFNYKETVNAIDTEDGETFGTGIIDCGCSNSTFCDPTHGHIITGDLRIIQNQKLRKLITKGPNFREGKL